MDEEDSLRKEAKKHYKILKEKVNRFLVLDNPPDVLIIKAHLICEYYINQILILKDVCRASELSRMSFYEKVQKAFNKDLPQERERSESVLGLNKIRNKVGHELEYSLSESDIDSIGLIAGKEYLAEKYNFPSQKELLRNTLLVIALDLSFDVFELIELYKISKTKK